MGTERRAVHLNKKPEVQGIEKGTLYRKVEEWLKEYRAMKARVEILKAELDTISRSEGLGVYEGEDEAIAGMYFNRGPLTGLPMGTETSDKTGRVAAEFRDQLEKDFKRVWRMYVADRTNKWIEYEALVIQLHRIDLAIESLLPREQEVVRAHYIDGLGWERISRKVHCDVATCYRTREKAILYMTLSLFPRRPVE